MAERTVVPLGERREARAPREPALRQVFGSVLRRTRLAQQRTLADVAAQAQVSTPYLSEIERGLKEASSEVLASICRALDMQVLDLVAQAHGELSAVQHPRAASQLGATRLRSRFDPHGSPVALAA
jgi:transcriptional regulator with XRE-family HTH domain